MNNKGVCVDRIIEICLNVNLFELLNLWDRTLICPLHDGPYRDVFSVLKCNKY